MGYKEPAHIHARRHESATGECDQHGPSVRKTEQEDLQAARLASEEGELEKNLRGVIPSKSNITTLKIDTIYEETDDVHVVGTENGTEVCLLKICLLLDAQDFTYF